MAEPDLAGLVTDLAKKPSPTAASTSVAAPDLAGLMADLAGGKSSSPKTRAEAETRLGNPSTTFLPSPSEMAGAVARGVNRGLVGPAQLVGDFVAPETTSQLTAAFNKWNAPPAGARPWVETTGGVVGETLPILGAMAAAPAVGLLQGTTIIGQALQSAFLGGASGGLAYQSGETADDRLSGRALTMGAGGVLGGITGAVGGVVTKLSNARAIARDVTKVQEQYANADPALADVRGTILAQVDKLQRNYNAKSAATISAGDSLGPINLSSVEQKLRDLLPGVETAVNPNKKAVTILDNVIDTLAPERTWPKQLIVGGKRFTLTPTNQYAGADGAVLPDGPVRQILEQRGVAPPPQVGYGQMKSTLEELNTFLKGNEATDPATRAVRSARDLLQETFDAWKTPGVRSLEKGTDAFYQRNLAQYDREGVKKLLNSTDPLERANVALEAALGPDAHVATTVAKLIGERGQEAVRVGLVKKALDAGFDPKTGGIDAVRFAGFFKDTPNADPFMNVELSRQVLGIRNLLTETAQRQGYSSEVRLVHPGGFGFIPSLQSLGSGDFKKAAIEMSAAMFSTPIFTSIERIMTDKFGRSLLSAAATAKPGSPEMARLMQTLTRKFLPVAEGPASAATLGQRE